jgi:hypothetical protein
MFPATEILGFKVAIIPGNTGIKIIMRDKTHQLAENIFSGIHMPKIAKMTSNRLEPKIR